MGSCRNRRGACEPAARACTLSHTHGPIQRPMLHCPMLFYFPPSKLEFPGQSSPRNFPQRQKVPHHDFARKRHYAHFIPLTCISLRFVLLLCQKKDDELDELGKCSFEYETIKNAIENCITKQTFFFRQKIFAPNGKYANDREMELESRDQSVFCSGMCLIEIVISIPL